ncbi:phage/plasmid primase, P4 family [Floridanema evergladense]|uniref:Phage/plasmid primase, P4 family n=1 Tax=Floridaenema evergladense BLCC-F167 TaxID=3153639 RepID=A0ABV4WG86_9CYAN
MYTTNDYNFNSLAGQAREVSKNEPCPICGKEDWCYIHEDGNILCGRTDIAPDGWKIIGKSRDDRNVFAPIKDRDTHKAREFRKVLPNVQAKRKAFKSAPLPDQVILAKGSMPKSERKLHQDLKLGECYLTVYDYGDGRSVYRYESINGEPLPGKKSSKICLPFCDGKFEKGEDIWTAYRLNEALKAVELSGGNAIISGEGEKVIDCLWEDLNLASFTFQGSAWTEDNIKPAIELLKAKDIALTYLPDNDAEGQRKAEKLAKICAESGVPYIQINPTDIDTECQNKDDIVDILKRMGKDQVLAKIEAQINKVLSDYQNRIDNNTGEETKKQNLPPADIVAKEIAEDYRGTLAFNNETGTWMRYEAEYPGVWSPESDEYLESIISKILDSKNIVGYGSNSYVVNIVKKLRHILIERKWTELKSNEYLPFINGVLNVKTGELLPHSPGYKLTWQLPREHNPLAKNWGTIDEFLTHLTRGNEKLKHLLICYCAAILKGRSDLQKFLYLIGLGGTGKGTFTRLNISLIGKENVLTTTMEDWCGNRFEGANAYGKRLILFPDEDKQIGKIGKFLSLTGEDLIRAEEKGKKAFSFKCTAIPLVCSNFPIFVGDSASRVKRRCITVPCNNAVVPSQRRNLEKEFEPELAAFTNHLISIPDDEITRTLLGLEEIPEVTQEFWQNQLRTNSIAAWLNDCVIPDPMAKTAIGCDKNEGEKDTPKTLFGSYSWHCKGTGDSAKSHKNFSPDLIELCQSVLGWKVERVVGRDGRFIKGIRLRTDNDKGIPTHEMQLEQALKPTEAIATEPPPITEPELPVTESPPLITEPELPVTEPSPPITEPELPKTEPEPLPENATQTEIIIANLEPCQWEEKAVIEAAGEFGIELVSDAIAYAPIEKRHSLTEQLKKFDWEVQDMTKTLKNAVADNLSFEDASFIREALAGFRSTYGKAADLAWKKLSDSEKAWVKELMGGKKNG